MRVVLDTNVLISALITEGKSNKLLKALFAGDHTLVLSDPIMDELSRVASDAKIRRYIDDVQFGVFLTMLLSKAAFVRVKSKIRIFDNPDDIILSTAKDGKAKFIVTGDAHILELKEFEGIKTITIDEMLSILRVSNSFHATK